MLPECPDRWNLVYDFSRYDRYYNIIYMDKDRFEIAHTCVLTKTKGVETVYLYVRANEFMFGDLDKTIAEADAILMEKGFGNFKFQKEEIEACGQTWGL